MPRALERFLDNITMYRLMRYYLLGLLFIATGLSAAGALHFNPFAIAGATTLLAVACLTFNWIFARVFSAPYDSDSSLITASILALIITPTVSWSTALFLVVAAGLAMASKYILTIRRKHIFNPAAVAVVLTALGPHQAASWWVGNAVMLPFVLIGGVLIIRKIRRTAMFVTYLIVTTVTTALLAYLVHLNVVTGLQNMALSSAVFFLGFVMLTEPQTSPPTGGKQLIYGALVGALLPPQVHILSFYSSPEISLLVGNIFTYIFSAKEKLFLVLKKKTNIAANTVEFVFTSPTKLAHQPGQYMEFTLPHSDTDARGVRRYFTLASSPTEPDIHLGVKFYQPGSSYKRAMLDMDERTQVVAAQVAGDFVLPRDRQQKVAFLAGGIGITPFRSMVKYMLDSGDHRNAVLLYSARARADIAYGALFEQARLKLGLRTAYVLSEEPRTNMPNAYTGTVITREIVAREVPDYAERVFYISGTHPMVQAMRGMLLSMGVPHRRIKTDFFPGYV